jgi:hypothetical protein
LDLSEFSYPQKQRLAYIDFKLLFVGHFSRSEIITFFEKGHTSATRDIKLYKELCPNNLLYDNREKKYYQTQEFIPLFEHDSRKTLIKLSNQISDGLDAVGNVSFPVEAPSQLNIPNIFIVAKLVQAIVNKWAVAMNYTSLSSGATNRTFVPHSIVDNGLRWHIRGYDRNTNSFRDFVLTRVLDVEHIKEPLDVTELKEADNQWMRVMPLHLVPHPVNVQQPKAIELDYAMVDGVLELDVRAAMAGYLLRRWNVDCTSDAELVGAEYQLWLKNRKALFGAENLTIAPGYVPELEEL